MTHIYFSSASPESGIQRTQTEWTLLKSSLNNLADFYDIQWKWASTAAGGKETLAAREITIRGHLRPTVEPGVDGSSIQGVAARSFDLTYAGHAL